MGRVGSGVTYASGWVLRLLAAGQWSGSAVRCWRVRCRPVRAALTALSMPGLRPVACPPEGMGGGLKGSAGLHKAGHPGRGTEGCADRRGSIVCTGGDGAGALTAAVDGGRNMPVAGACVCASDGDTGAWLVTLVNGEIPDMPLLVLGADNGDWLINEPACEAPEVAGEIAAVAACSVALITPTSSNPGISTHIRGRRRRSRRPNPRLADGNARAPITPPPKHPAQLHSAYGRGVVGPHEPEILTVELDQPARSTPPAPTG